MNDRLSAQEAQSNAANPSESDTKLIRNSLAHLGLTDVAVTSDAIKDNQQYHEALAKELAGVLGRKGGIMKDGLVGLDEVWCVWNRARGVGESSLIPIRTLTDPALRPQPSSHRQICASQLPTSSNTARRVYTFAPSNRVSLSSIPPSSRNHPSRIAPSTSSTSAKRSPNRSRLRSTSSERRLSGRERRRSRLRGRSGWLCR